MSTENHVVADFYARLWPWIDHAQPMRVMLDDGGKGETATPDLCFQFVGSQRELRIEFKVLEGGQITPTRKQLDTWGAGANGPHLWIAKVPDEPHYLIWRHDDERFLAAFRARAAKDTTRRSVAPPNQTRLRLPGVFAKLLAFAEAEGFLTQLNQRARFVIALGTS